MFHPLRYLKNVAHVWFGPREQKPIARPTRAGLRRAVVRVWLERLEERLAPATVSDGATALLSIALGAGENLAIVSKGTNYTFTSNQAFTAAGATNPTKAGSDFSGFGTTTLTLTSSGIAQYATGISITDAGANATVTFNDSGAAAYSNNFNVALSNPAAGAIYFFGASSFGAANIQASTTLGIQASFGAVLSSSSGNLTLQANQQSSPTSGFFSGVAINNSTIRCTGSGAITVKGRAGTLGGTNEAGVSLFGGNINGGTGPVTVTGAGNTNDGNSFGVLVSGSDIGNTATITSLGGDVQITGKGGGSGIAGTFFGNNNGVYVRNGGLVSAGGMGNVTITGTGGATTAQVNTGVYITGTVTSSGGNVQVSGQGASVLTSPSSDAYGVYIQGNGIVSAGGAGTVTVMGTGGNSKFDANYGVNLLGNGTITSAGGDVRVIGHGGTNVTSSDLGNNGVVLTGSPLISSGGSGNVFVQGTATGVTQGAVAPGIELYGGAINAVGKSITLSADAVDLSAGLVNAGTGTVSLAPLTSGTLITFGAANASHQLGLSAVQMASIAAATLNIGNAASGTITTAPITLANATNLNLTSGGDISLAGPINTSGGPLTLTPGSGRSVIPAGIVTTTIVSTTVSLAAGSNLAIHFANALQNSQLGLTGNVNISGANLVLSGSAQPVDGQTYTLINNNGNAPIVGTFNGLPEGAIIPNILGSTLSATISYVGGAGHDVVLYVGQRTATSAALSASASSATYGQLNPVSFTATVTAASGTPAGNVEFFDATTGLDQGAGVFQGSSGSTSTWILHTFHTQLQTTGPNPDAFRAVYIPQGGFFGSAAVLPGGLTVYPAALTVSGTVGNDKVYDQTTAATVHFANLTLNSVILGDSVTLDASNVHGTFASQDVGSNIRVAVTGLKLIGPKAQDYALVQPTTTANVNPATVTVSGIAADKVYDGTTTGVLDASTPVFTGLYPGDAVTLVTTSATATFASKNVGTNIAVNITGLTLSGPQAIDYTAVAAAQTARITPVYLQVAGITSSNKVYDGTNQATLSGANAVFTGLVPGDSVTVTSATGTFASKDVGTNIPVRVATVTLGGSQGTNYFPVALQPTANITPATLTLQGTLPSKVYDGTTAYTANLTAASFTGSIPSGVVAKFLTARFASKDVGTNIPVTVTGFTLTGLPAVDFVLNVVITGSITPLTLTVIGAAAGLTANNKVYDGTTTASLTPASPNLPGVIAGDTVFLQGATGKFASKDVGTAIPVSVTSLMLAGRQAADYTAVLTQPLPTAANITPAPLAVSGITANNKLYDGTKAATLSIATAALTGIKGSDTVTLNSSAAVGAFASQNVGQNIPVIVSSLTIGGPQAGDYSLPPPILKANIELAPPPGPAALMVKDINKNTSGSAPTPFGLIDLNGTLIFEADDGINGPGIWKSDGTTAGTLLIKSFPNFSNQVPRLSKVASNLVYFTMTDNAGSSRLWRTDGTPAGTFMLGTTLSASFDDFDNTQTAAIGNVFYFSAYSTAKPNDFELWRSDGTVAGTFMVKQINAAASGSFPRLLTAVGNKLYFTATDGVHGQELWVSDGTAAGTLMVSDLTVGPSDSTFGSIVNYNGTLFFTASAGGFPTQLWRSDGTTQGTSPILAGAVFNLTVVNNTLFFALPAPNAALWKSDGTISGTVPVKSFGVGSTSELVNVNGKLFFMANDGTHGLAPWISDGTTSGTTLLQTINPAATGFGVNLVSSPAAALNGLYYFVAAEPTHGLELWSSDGTTPGTALVADINPGAAAAFDVNPFLTVSSGKLFFVANDGVHGREVWRLNYAPIEPGQAYAVAADTPLVVASPGLLQGAFDRDTDVLAAALVSGPAHGQLALNTDGSFTYIPATGYSGLDSFTFTALDAFTFGNLATVNLRVNDSATPLSTATVMTSSQSTVAYGTPVTFSATVTASSGTLAGSVEFFDDTAATDLGPGTLQSSAPGTATWGYTTTPTQLQATGAGADAIRAVYAPAGNFFPSQGTLPGGETVMPLSIIVAGVTANNKVYDHTTAATINTAGAVFPGLLPGDSLALSTAAASAAFASKDVGNGLTVMVSGLALAGPQANDYVLAQATLALTANITPAPLTLTWTGADKVYDSTTTVPFNSALTTFGNMYSGDSVTLNVANASAVFASKDAGNGIPVIASGLTLGGPQGMDYALVQPTPTATATIKPAPLTVAGVTGIDKVYDGTTAAALKIAGATLGPTLPGDAVTFVKSAVTGSFAMKDAGNSVAVKVTGFTLTGAQANDYALAQPNVTANIFPAPLTVTGIAASDKVYDGSNTTTLDTPRTVLGTGDILVSDEVFGGPARIREFTPAGTLVRTFNFPGLQPRRIAVDANGNIDVFNSTSSALMLTTLDAATGNVIANIPFTGWGNGGNLLNGGLAAYGKYVFATNLGTPSGIIAFNIDNQTSQLFANGILPYQLTIGQDGLLYANTTGRNFEVYDPRTLAHVRTINFQTPGFSGLFSVAVDKNGNLFGVGPDFKIFEYDTNGTLVRLLQTTNTKTFSDIGLSASGQIEAIAGDTLFFTDTSLNSVTSLKVGAIFDTQFSTWAQPPANGRGTITGVLPGDTVILNSSSARGNFTSSSAGPRIPVAISGLSLQGPQGGDYTVAGATTSANITPATLTIAGVTANDKVYDGTTTGTVNTAHAVVTGLLTGDTVTVSPNGSTDTFASKDVGQGVPVTVTGLSLGGPQGSDYTLTPQALTLTANITPATLAVTGITANDKLYDGNVTATLNTGGAALGVFAGDTVTLSTASATGIFASKDVGTAITVTVNGLTISGAQVADYTLAQPTTTANITPTPLTVTGITANNKVFDATTTATLNTASATLAGVIAGETVTLNTAGATGTFVSKDVGTNVIVNVSGLAIRGSQVGDYTLILPTTAANIIPAIVAHPPIPVIGNYNQLEGTTGYTPFIFHVSLAVAPAQPITYDVYTTDGSAVSTGTNPNFVAIAPDVNGLHSIGTVGFAPGQVAQTITVYVITGSLAASAGSKTFLVQMSNPTTPNVSLAAGTGTIIPQNSPTRSAGGGLPKVLVGNSTMLEGASGLTPFKFQVRLASASPVPVTYDVYTTDGTAVSAGANPNFMGITAGFTAPYSHGTITFSPGQISQTVTVYVIAGSIPLSAGIKTFTVKLSDPAHPAIALATATGTIIPQNAQIPAATPAEARPPVMQKAVNRLIPFAAVTEARAVSVLPANSPSGTTATVAAPQLANQVFQIGTAPALNSLLYGNSPGQLAAVQMFQDMVRGTDAPAEFNMLSSFQDSLSDVAAQHPDWLAIPSQSSAPETRTDSLAGWPTQQAVAQQLVWDLATVDKLFAALGEEMDDTVES